MIVLSWLMKGVLYLGGLIILISCTQITTQPYALFLWTAIGGAIAGLLATNASWIVAALPGADEDDEREIPTVPDLLHSTLVNLGCLAFLILMLVAERATLDAVRFGGMAGALLLATGAQVFVIRLREREQADEEEEARRRESKP